MNLIRNLGITPLLVLSIEKVTIIHKKKKKKAENKKKIKENRKTVMLELLFNKVVGLQICRFIKRIL